MASDMDDTPLFEATYRALNPPKAGGAHHWRDEPITEEIRLPEQPEHVLTADPARKLGKLPPYPDNADHPRVRLAPFLDTTAAAAAPPLVDWMSKVPDSSWGMLANDRYGCCMWADIAHAILAVSTYGQGAPQAISEADVLAAYSGCTGFNPNDPSTDQGTVMQDAMNYWRRTGVGGHKCLAFAQVDHTDPAQVNAALNMFGAIHLGISFPASAMDQFNAHQPWTPQRGSRIEGGHAIHCGRDGDGYTITTWGRPQVMTDSFWSKYVEEAWVAITPEWLSVVGKTPTGLDLHGLGEQVAKLTGGPNPFASAPNPQPNPNPAPTPAPGQPPSDIDGFLKWLWTQIQTWLKQNGSK